MGSHCNPSLEVDSEDVEVALAHSEMRRKSIVKDSRARISTSLFGFPCDEGLHISRLLALCESDINSAM